MSKLLDYTGLGRFLDKLKALFIQKQSTAILGNITVFDEEGSVIDGGKSIALTLAVFFGTIDSTSTAAELTATVDGLTEIVPGTTVYIYNGVISGSSSCTLNINDLGALPIYRGGNESSRVGFSKNHTWQLIYNPVRVTGGCWDMLYGQYSYVNLGYYDRESDYNFIVKEDADRGCIAFTYSNTEILPIANNYVFTNLDFDPFRPIYLININNNIAGDSVLGSSLYLRNGLDLRNFIQNPANYLVFHKNVYLLCEPLIDSNGNRTGRVKISTALSCPLVQELPVTEDGYVYIFLGSLGSQYYQFRLIPVHPIYEFRNGALRLWTNLEEISNWALLPTKPTYTPEEVGALPASTVVTTGTQILCPGGVYKTKTFCGGTMLLLTYDDSYVLPINTYVIDATTSKTLTSLSFDPFGLVYYYSEHALRQENEFPSFMWTLYFGTIDIRYSFNVSEPLIVKTAIYIVMVPLADGRCKLHTSPITQTLPNTEDGLVYKRIGYVNTLAYSQYYIILEQHKPCYYYKDGAIRQWTNAKEGTSATTLSGYGITDAKIENGVITLGSNTITPLTAHLSLSNYVTLNSALTITGEKTFTGTKRINFKQGTTTDKLGFTLYNNSSKEVGYLEWQPTGLNSKPTLVLGSWIDNSNGTTPGYLGFKVNNVPGAAYYMLMTPLASDAKTPLGLSSNVTTLYFPLQFKNGSSTVLTANTGVVDLSSLLSDYLTLAAFNTNNPDLAAIEALSGTSGILKKTAANTWELGSSAIGVTPVVNHGTSDTTFALTPNIYHKWGSVSSLTLTLAAPDDVSVMNEYIFSFTSPATPTTLSIPASVNWITPLDIEPSKEYRVSIIDNLATWITSDMVVPIGDVNTPEFATKAYVDAGLALKEDSSNKVTSVDENSTDTQYPSAKAMYDALNPE